MSGGSLGVDLTMVAALVYAGGVLLGLARIDAGPVARTALAVLWPLGPLAFAVTVAILIIAAFIAFPWFGIGVAAAGVAGWWLLR